MNNFDPKGERSIALFLLGILLFNPPLLSIFGVDVAFSGIPLLYIYLFLAWAGFILLMGLISERGQERRRSRRVPPLPGDEDPVEQTQIRKDSLPHSITPRPNTAQQLENIPARSPSNENENW